MPGWFGPPSGSCSCCGVDDPPIFPPDCGECLTCCRHSGNTSPRFSVEISAGNTDAVYRYDQVVDGETCTVDYHYDIGSLMGSHTFEMGPSGCPSTLQRWFLPLSIPGQCWDPNPMFVQEEIAVKLRIGGIVWCRWNGAPNYCDDPPEFIDSIDIGVEISAVASGNFTFFGARALLGGLAYAPGSFRPLGSADPTPGFDYPGFAAFCGGAPITLPLAWGLIQAGEFEAAWTPLVQIRTAAPP